MFDHKSHFEKLAGKYEYFYDDIKSLNSVKNVTIDNFIHITNNLGRISNNWWTEYPDGTIVECSYQDIDKPLNINIKKNN